MASKCDHAENWVLGLAAPTRMATSRLNDSIEPMTLGNIHNIADLICSRATALCELAGNR
jgi:hypothetical protein